MDPGCNLPDREWLRALYDELGELVPKMLNAQKGLSRDERESLPGGWWVRFYRHIKERWLELKTLTPQEAAQILNHDYTIWNSARDARRAAIRARRHKLQSAVFANVEIRPLDHPVTRAMLAELEAKLDEPSLREEVQAMERLTNPDRAMSRPEITARYRSREKIRELLTQSGFLSLILAGWLGVACALLAGQPTDRQNRSRGEKGINDGRAVALVLDRQN